MTPGVAIALDVLFGLLDRVTAIQSLIATAQAEKRDVTTAELDALGAADDVARAALDAAIANAKKDQ